MGKPLYLDIWTAEKIGVEKLTESSLEVYHLDRLKAVVAYAKENCRFYAELLKDFEVRDMEDFRWLPFTRSDQLVDFGLDMICVAQKEINRIVSLDTGGSTGESKRVFFTEADQELTVDFFHHGMQNLIDENDRLLILMPYERTGSVGDLLRMGVKRLGAEVYCLGLIGERLSYNTILDTIYNREITSIVALPGQAYDLMKHTTKLTLSTVLLSGDYVSHMVTADLSAAWGCHVYEHYGMTEMGLGGAVSCSALSGYHIRESDLFVEIMDPANGEVLPEGRWGEIVFTTLNREAMPLIRYRTGDTGRIIDKACSCGSVLRRLDKVKSRNLKKGWL